MKQTKYFFKLFIICAAFQLFFSGPFLKSSPAGSVQPLPKITYQGLHSRTFKDNKSIETIEHKPQIQASNEQNDGIQSVTNSSAEKKQTVDTGLAKSLLKKGTQEAKAGNLEKAKSLIEQSLKANPTNIAALNNLGLVLRKMGKYNEASERYREALTISPDYPLTHKNYGVLLEIMALKEYRKYCELVPDSAKKRKVEEKIQRLTR